MSKVSKAFGSQRAYKKHLILGKGGVAGEVGDLRNDVEEGFKNSEAKSGYPELDAIDPGTLLAAGQASLVLTGRNLVQSQTFDTLITGLVNAAVTVTMLKPGDSAVSLVVTQGAGALSAVLAAGVLTVELAVGNSTATEVTAAINVSVSCVGVIHAVAGGTGADDVLVAALTALAGGVGLYSGNNVTINGQSCNPVQAADQWKTDSITVLVPALTGRVATDIVAVTIESDGIRTGQLSAVLT